MDESVVEAIKKLSSDDFAKLLHENAPDHYTHLFNAGHSKARKEYGDKLTAKESDLEALKAEIAQRDSSISELSKSKPDVAEIEAKYKEANNQLAKKLEEKDALFQSERGDLLGRIRGGNTDRFRSEVVSFLVAKGVDPDYADFKSRDEKFLGRIDFDKEQIVGLRQADGVTAVPNPSNRPLHELLAREAMADVPSKFIDDRRMSGAGIGNGSADGRTFTMDQVRGMSDDDFEKNLGDIIKSADQLAG